jgi:hypothetical protein
MGRISEERLEGVHRTYSKEKSRASAAGLPWICASGRLMQNLSISEQWLAEPSTRAAFEWNWIHYKVILQKPGLHWSLRQFQPRRMKTRAFTLEIHRLGVHTATSWAGLHCAVLLAASSHSHKGTPWPHTVREEYTTD